ncbi:hypothetical protein [Rhodococcus sp. OK519]|uniref:hypothetical protein n=1 Tax=Rhodococcus sp. OK519 TaxID=2135729 RepID=UPI003B970F25
MATPVLAVRAATDLRHVAAALSGAGTCAVPVVDGFIPIGTVTWLELVRALTADEPPACCPGDGHGISSLHSPPIAGGRGGALGTGVVRGGRWPPSSRSPTQTAGLLNVVGDRLARPALPRHGQSAVRDAIALFNVLPLLIAKAVEEGGAFFREVQHGAAAVPLRGRADQIAVGDAVAHHTAGD